MTTSTKRLLTIFLPILTGLLLVLFWEGIIGIPNQISLWSMDGSPLYNHDFKAQTWRELTGRNWLPHMLGMPGATRVFQPDDLLKFLFPPLVYHLMSWICAFLLILGATYYLLTTYGIKGLRAALPALALGFSGYTFTLISAGHRATPMSMGYAILAMALVRQGIRKNTISHFIAAGLACVYGIINQMDLMGFLLILIAAYGILQLVLHWPVYRNSKLETRNPDENNQPHSTSHVPRPTSHLSRLTFQLPPLPRLAIAIALAAATFLLVGWPFLSQTFFGAANGRSTLEFRQEQIEQTGGDRWEFITNWSLPPEGILEFIAPSVFGRENVSREVPYWGRLGQSLSWPETGQGFRNFRQHNLYVGGIQIAFAFYALFALFQQGETSFSRKRRIEVAFWLCATILTLLLAFGRYTPLYRLIYHLPVLGNVRAPVKWFHLTEVTIVILMAFGLDALLKDLQAIAANQIDHKKNKNNAPRLPVRFAIGTTCTAVLLLIVSSIAQSTGFGLQSLWAAHGLEPIAPQLRNALAGAFFHATLVFAALAAILWLLLKQTADRRPQTTDLANQHSLESLPSSVFRLLSVLLLVLALDLAVAHKPYIHVEDVSAFYAPNPIADIVLEHNPSYRVADLLTSRGKHDPLWRNFLMKGVDMLLPQAGQRPTDDVQALFDALKDNPLRLWQMTSTRYIMLQRAQAESLLQNPAISLRAGFRITQQAQIVLDNSPQAPFVLLEFAGALPRAYLVNNWQQMEPSQAILQLADPNFNPTRSVLVGETIELPTPSESTADELHVTKWTSNSRELTRSGSEPSIIIFTDAYNQGWEFTEGKMVRANGVFHAAILPAGEQNISIRKCANSSALISLICQCILLILTFVLLVIKPETMHSPPS